jgi:hypothetical protein
MEPRIENENGNTQIHSLVLVVNETPYCFWDANPNQTNTEFIKNTTTSYYRYLATTLAKDLSTENRNLAAAAIRSNYYHALETLFAFLFSTLQAPYYVPGWLQKYSNSDLRSLVEKVHKGDGDFATVFKPQKFTWKSITKLLFPSVGEPTADGIIQDGFSGLLSKFAEDFLYEKHVFEYNNSKHALRVQPGGFSLVLFDENPEGKNLEDGLQLEGSKFGSGFYTVEKILDKNKSNWKLRQNFINWSPEQLVEKTRLVSKTLQNILNIIQIMNGADKAKLAFEFPNSVEQYTSPWNQSFNAKEASFGLDLDAKPEDLPSAADIMARYDSNRLA